MTIDDFQRRIKAKQKELQTLVRRTLPVKIGRMAKDHFQNNFRQGGFVNGGLHPWPTTRRQQDGGTTAAAQYGPLLSGRNHLFSSIKYVPQDAAVTVSTDVPYAPLHNEGGTVTTHPRVTPKMRKFAWARFFKAGGKPKDGEPSQEAAKWKALALTKKDKLSVTAQIPKRQFIGESRELNQAISQKIEQEVKNILEN